MGKFFIRKKFCIKQYKNSACDKCEQVCPAGAIVEGVVDEGKCNACGRCYAVCPTGAIATSVALERIIASYDQQAALCLTCQKVKRGSEIPCLAILHEKILCALAHKAQVSVDLSKCEDCHDKTFAVLRAIIINCNKNLCEQRQITVIEQDGHPLTPVNMDRRHFLRQMLGASVSFIEEVQKDDDTEICKPCSLDLFLRDGFTPAQAAANDLFFSCVIDSQCNACGLCVKICPHKALRLEIAGQNTRIFFERRLCSGCGLCETQCPKSAVEISQQFQAAASFLVAMPHCNECGEAFQPIGDETTCLNCIKNGRILK